MTFGWTLKFILSSSCLFVAQLLYWPSILFPWLLFERHERHALQVQCRVLVFLFQVRMLHECNSAGKAAISDNSRFVYDLEVR
jgi:hypothetical protein